MSYEVDIAAEADAPIIRELELAMFDQQDLVNLILQRSEILYDVPRAGRVIRAWNHGDVKPILDQVERLGHEIAYRTAAVIHAEYRQMSKSLKKLKPKRIADIGCGYAFFTLFAARQLKSKLLLIDLEHNERRHFGFESEGAAYSSLVRAKEVLVANGIAAKDIHTLNPEKNDVMKAGKVDLAVSFLSCGFHYPVSLYENFFKNSISDKGACIIDLREATAEQQIELLESYGLTVEEHLEAAPKVRRILFKKGET